MDTFSYRCDQCEVQSERTYSKTQARAFRDTHRRKAHHGLTPDRDRILRHPPEAAPWWVPLNIFGALFVLLLLITR
ncbi:hypothetical protein ACIQCG_00675 [Streptomyces noursei]|uniref:hypothetical protein n=1 Tax=Streptomyces noursei TaxID=1971 RepID=UPI00381961E4